MRRGSQLKIICHKFNQFIHLWFRCIAVKKIISLEEKCKDEGKLNILEAWDYEHNYPLTPKDVSFSSQKKVFWKGCCGHSWEARISNRFYEDSGCPYCSNQKVLKGYNDLATTNPEVSKQWDYARNTFLPNEVCSGSGKTAYFFCANHHSYKRRIVEWSNGGRCPYCAGKRILAGFNDLATLHPEIISEWDFEKNSVKPSEIASNYQRKVWWKCSKGHSYQMVPSAKALQKCGCPVCSKVRRTSFPEQVVFYYISKCFHDAINSYKPEWLHSKEIDIFIPSIKTGIEYDGVGFHKSASKDASKDIICKDNGVKLIHIREIGCPRMPDSSIVINADSKNLTEALKQLIAYLDHNIDIDIERDRTEIMSKYISYERGISLSDLYPEIANEWDYEKNGTLSPDYFMPKSNTSVYWLCPEGHSYKQAIASRTQQKQGCPICSNKIIVSGENDFAKWCKDNNITLLDEWDYEKNERKPSSFSKGSGEKVWWKCKQGHSYQARIRERTRQDGKASGCPICGKGGTFVRNTETGQEFASLRAAAEANGTNHHMMKKVCEQNLVLNGYHWELIMNNNEKA